MDTPGNIVKAVMGEKIGTTVGMPNAKNQRA